MELNSLLKQVVQETGLPVEIIGPEIQRLIELEGKNLEDVSLDDLRQMLMKYLKDVLFHCLPVEDKDSAH